MPASPRVLAAFGTLLSFLSMAPPSSAATCDVSELSCPPVQGPTEVVVCQGATCAGYVIDQDAGMFACNPLLYQNDSPHERCLWVPCLVDNNGVDCNYGGFGPSLPSAEIVGDTVVACAFGDTNGTNGGYAMCYGAGADVDDPADPTVYYCLSSVFGAQNYQCFPVPFI